MEYTRRFLHKHPTMAALARFVYSILHFLFASAIRLYTLAAAAVKWSVAAYPRVCDAGHRVLCTLQAAAAACHGLVAALQAPSWLSSFIPRLQSLGACIHSLQEVISAASRIVGSVRRLPKSICEMYANSRNWVKLWSWFLAALFARDVVKILTLNHDGEAPASISTGLAHQPLISHHPEAEPVLTVCVPMSTLAPNPREDDGWPTYTRLSISYSRRQEVHASHVVEGVNFIAPNDPARTQHSDNFYCASAILPPIDQTLPATYPAPVVTGCFPLFLPLPLPRQTEGAATIIPTWNVTFTHRRPEGSGETGSYLDAKRRARCVDFQTWPAHEWDQLAVREGIDLGQERGVMRV